MDIPADYFGLIEGGISLFAVLAFAGWQLWTLREKPGDKAAKRNEPSDADKD